MDTWNGLKGEVVTATNIHKFKEMLDIWRYGDRTLGALLEPFIIQLGKYTHTHTHTGVVSMKKVMLAEGKPFIYNNNFPL